MNKKASIIIPVVIILASIFSCNDIPFIFNVDCDPDVCTLTEPDSADLIVHLTLNEENPYVPLIFYRGKIEDDLIEWIDTADTETLYLYSPVNEYYSIKAFYKSGAQTLIAVDGDKLKTSFITDVCEYDCWIIRGGILDVRLKD